MMAKIATAAISKYFFIWVYPSYFYFRGNRRVRHYMGRIFRAPKNPRKECYVTL
jgi:hypothetical protein